MRYCKVPRIAPGLYGNVCPISVVYTKWGETRARSMTDGVSTRYFLHLGPSRVRSIWTYGAMYKTMVLYIELYSNATRRKVFVPQGRVHLYMLPLTDLKWITRFPTKWLHVKKRTECIMGTGILYTTRKQHNNEQRAYCTEMFSIIP